MKRTTLTLIAALAAFATMVPATASAQRNWRNDRRPVAQRDFIVRPLVVRTERESNSFRAWFEKSSFRRDKDLKRNIQNLDENLERLRSRASDGRPGVGRDELNRALTQARVVDRKIAPRRQGVVVNREWNDLRRTLNDLARLYNVRGV